MDYIFFSQENGQSFQIHHRLSRKNRSVGCTLNAIGGLSIFMDSQTWPDARYSQGLATSLRQLHSIIITTREEVCVVSGDACRLGRSHTKWDCSFLS